MKLKAKKLISTALMLCAAFAMLITPITAHADNCTRHEDGIHNYVLYRIIPFSYPHADSSGHEVFGRFEYKCTYCNQIIFREETQHFSHDSDMSTTHPCQCGYYAPH